MSPLLSIFFLFSRIHPNELLTEHDELMTCLFVRIFPFDKTVNIFILCHIAKYIIEVCNTTKICFCYPFVRILDSGRFRIWNKISALFGILWRFLSENCGRVYVYQALQATKDKLKSHRCNELEKNGKVIQPHLEMHATHIMKKNG